MSGQLTEGQERFLVLLGVGATGTATVTPPESKSADEALKYGAGYRGAYGEADPENVAQLKKLCENLGAGQMPTATDWADNPPKPSTEDQQWRETNAERVKEAISSDQLQPGDMTRMLAFADTPQNNPERGKIGALLQQLQDLQPKDGDSLDPTYLKDKTQLVDVLTRQIYQWHDRRSHQQLPPSAEAVFLSDRLQLVHRDLVLASIAQGVVPVAGAADLPADEREELEKNWKSLCQGGGKIVAPTADEDPQFRAETLANFARLLSIPAGRHLVSKLSRAERTITFEKGPEPECKNPSVNGRIAIVMNSGAEAMDSALSSRTQSGSHLYDAQFNAMGHELIHALHHNYDKIRLMVPLDTLSPLWSNSEEYRTILKGKTSEQTLRHQYGLTAERFGHKQASNIRSPEGTKALGQVLEAETQIEATGTDQIDAAIEELGFEPGALGNTLKLQLYHASPKPSGEKLKQLGWLDPNQLTLAQMLGIVDHEIAFKLPELGWSPFQLPDVVGDGDTIQGVTDAQRCHPRSPRGHRFGQLGGEKARNAISKINSIAQTNLGVGSDADWLSQLADLEEASKYLKTNYQQSPFREIVTRNLNLAVVLPRLAYELRVANNPLPPRTVKALSNCNTYIDLAETMCGTQETTDGKNKAGLAVDILSKVEKELEAVQQNVRDMDRSETPWEDLSLQALVADCVRQQNNFIEYKGRLARGQADLGEALKALQQDDWRGEGDDGRMTIALVKSALQKLENATQELAKTERKVTEVAETNVGIRAQAEAIKAGKLYTTADIQKRGASLTRSVEELHRAFKDVQQDLSADASTDQRQAAVERLEPHLKLQEDVFQQETNRLQGLVKLPLGEAAEPLAKLLEAVVKLGGVVQHIRDELIRAKNLVS